MPHSLLNRTEPGSAARHPPGSWQTQKIPSPKGRDHEVPRYHPCSPTSARGTRVSLTHSVRRTALLTVGDSVGAYLAATPVVDRWTKHFGPRLGRDVRQGVSRLLSPSGPHWRTGQTRCAIVPRYSSPSQPLSAKVSAGFPRCQGKRPWMVTAAQPVCSTSSIQLPSGSCR